MGLLNNAYQIITIDYTRAHKIEHGDIYPTFVTICKVSLKIIVLHFGNMGPDKFGLRHDCNVNAYLLSYVG